MIIKDFILEHRAEFNTASPSYIAGLLRHTAFALNPQQKLVLWIIYCYKKNLSIDLLSKDSRLYVIESSTKYDIFITSFGGEENWSATEANILIKSQLFFYKIPIL